MGRATKKTDKRKEQTCDTEYWGLENLKIW